MSAPEDVQRSWNPDEETGEIRGWSIPAQETLKNEAALAVKMNKIMQDCRSLAKKGTNKAQGYSFVKESQVSEVIQEAMIKHGVAFYPSEVTEGVTDAGKTKSGAQQWLVQKTMSFTFVDAETGHSRTSVLTGHGIDFGDKAANKAHTQAVKYILLKTFLIMTDKTDEDDGDRDSPEAGNYRAGKTQLKGQATDKMVKYLYRFHKNPVGLQRITWEQIDVFLKGDNKPFDEASKLIEVAKKEEENALNNPPSLEEIGDLEAKAIIDGVFTEEEVAKFREKMGCKGDAVSWSVESCIKWHSKLKSKVGQ